MAIVLPLSPTPLGWGMSRPLGGKCYPTTDASQSVTQPRYGHPGDGGLPYTGRGPRAAVGLTASRAHGRLTPPRRALLKSLSVV